MTGDGFFRHGDGGTFSMDWSKGKLPGKPHELEQFGTSMVSGEDVPLNQSIDLLVADFQIEFPPLYKIL